MDTSKYVKNGFTGIENIGNTCFINSCIQIINHTYELNEFFDSDKYKTHLKTDIIDSYATVAWDDLRRTMWSCERGTVSPNKFVHYMQELAKKKDMGLFGGYSQNDMSEFFVFMINCIHTSISRGVQMNIYGNLRTKTDKLGLECYKLLQSLYQKEYSEIVDLYYGIYVNQITDVEGKIPYVLKPESYFTLDLPIVDGNTIMPSLIDCLDLFTKPDLLSGDNAWLNEKTNQKQDVNKNVVFWNFPKILVIVLKRITPDGTRKIHANVDFPITDLDLSKYVLGYDPESYVYDLFGICNHFGGTNGGHYTAFVKHASNKWVHFNDNVVEIIENPSHIVTPHAYCLFYRKKNNGL